jgi:hypothetical protein
VSLVNKNSNNTSNLIMVGWESPVWGCFSDITSCLLVMLPCGLCWMQATAVGIAYDTGRFRPCCLGVLCGCIGTACNR